MRDRAAAPEPEGVLMELFAHALGFERRLATIQRLQRLECTMHQMVAGVNAAISRDARIGEHSDQRMHAVIGLNFVAHPPSGVAPRSPTARISRIFIDSGSSYHVT